jgi:enterochelin esterase-like enzyme
VEVEDEEGDLITQIEELQEKLSKYYYKIHYL